MNTQVSQVSSAGGVQKEERPALDQLLERIGWGLFLIQNMVDKMNIIRDEAHHTVELIVYLEGEKHVSQPA